MNQYDCGTESVNKKELNIVKMLYVCEELDVSAHSVSIYT